MDCIELSLNDLQKRSYELADLVKKNYEPDLIIFIAKGGYLIAQYLGDRLGVPIVPVYAERQASGLKTAVAPLLKILPKFVKVMLREMEINSGVHNTIKERQVSFPNDAIIEKVLKAQKILIVDDSVDTGGSIVSIMSALQEIDTTLLDIRVALLNVFTEATDKLPRYYCLFHNTIMITPMSNDSKENGQFISLYNQYLKENGIE
jgi:phosphoribosyltransferase